MVEANTMNISINSIVNETLSIEHIARKKFARFANGQCIGVTTKYLCYVLC